MKTGKKRRAVIVFVIPVGVLDYTWLPAAWFKVYLCIHQRCCKNNDIIISLSGVSHWPL